MTLLLTATLAFAAEGAFPYPVHHSELDNGLDLYVVPMPSPGAATVYTWMSVGSRDEVDEGRTGFAHFFEHLMFFGTPTLGGNDREDEIMRLGIEENAWTWFDETVYHGVVSADRVERYLQIEADCFQNLKLTPDNVERESGAVYGEFRKGQASASQALSVELWATAFTAHTYGHDTIGYEADIQAMPTAHPYAEAFFDRFYRPENANLLVVGDVDPEQVLAWVERDWGTWEPGPEPRPEIAVEPEQTELRSVHVDWTTPTAPRLVMAWKGPAHDPTQPDVAVLTLIEDLLLADTGVLPRRLVREEALAYDVSGGRYDLVDPSLFTIHVTLRDIEGRDQAEAIVREALAGLAEVDAETLQRTANHRRYGFLTSLDEPVAVARALGWHLRRHDDPDALVSFYDALASATPDDVARVAAATFVDARLTVGTLSPPAEEPASGGETSEGGAQ